MCMSAGIGKPTRPTTITGIVGGIKTVLDTGTKEPFRELKNIVQHEDPEDPEEPAVTLVDNPAGDTETSIMRRRRRAANALKYGFLSTLKSYKPRVGASTGKLGTPSKIPLNDGRVHIA